jgi:hypothetical protein
MHKKLTIFLVSGITYVTIEVAFSALQLGYWRLEGTSSLWMFLVGGLMGVSVGEFNKLRVFARLPYLVRVLLGMATITLVELVSGCTLNKGLGFHLWDYSASRFNFLGQIDALHTACWFLVTPLIFWLNAVIDHYVYGEERPVSLLSYYISLVVPKNGIMPI